GHSRPIEDIVAQDKCHLIRTDKFFSQKKSLCKSIRTRLFFIGDLTTNLRTISQELLEIWQILWCGDDENFIDTGQHQCRKWIIYHRLIVYRHKLLGYGKCQWM